MGPVSGGIVTALLYHRLLAAIPAGCVRPGRRFDQRDFFVTEAVQLVHELADFAVGMLDVIRQAQCSRR